MGKMSLRTAVENPEILAALYTGEPGPGRVPLHEVTLHRDGPTLRLRFDMPTFPDKPPKKWHPAFDTAQLTLGLYGVEKLEMTGFHPSERGALFLDRVEGKVQLRYTSSTCSISAAGLFARIEKMSGYCSGEEE